MSGVCSAHQGDTPVPGCAACVSTPAMVLGVTEEQWAAEMARAEATGMWTCSRCGFTQFYSHQGCCVLCSFPKPKPKESSAAQEGG